MLPDFCCNIMVVNYVAILPGFWCNDGNMHVLYQYFCNVFNIATTRLAILPAFCCNLARMCIKIHGRVIHKADEAEA